MLGSFEHHKKGLDDMISMHVYYELNNIFVECSNYLEHAMDQASKEVRIESLWLNLLL